ncbi:MAG: 50S ribosomal protein L13 [Synergistaceae bacterium]|nr:50S ribosomal protein L13 [Synergistaceae bacterium]
MIGTRSFMAKGAEVERKWFVVDATDKHLGRLAVQVARILTGKHKPTYTPHVDTGDFVVVVNAEKVGLTGKKRQQSTIITHSLYPGGLKTLTYQQVLERRPERLIERVVWGMLPKTKLGRDMYRKLKVYAGPSHPHEAQKPEQMN